MRARLWRKGGDWCAVKESRGCAACNYVAQECRCADGAVYFVELEDGTLHRVEVLRYPEQPKLIGTACVTCTHEAATAETFGEN